MKYVNFNQWYKWVYRFVHGDLRTGHLPWAGWKCILTPSRLFHPSNELFPKIRLPHWSQKFSFVFLSGTRLVINELCRKRPFRSKFLRPWSTVNLNWEEEVDACSEGGDCFGVSSRINCFEYAGLWVQYKFTFCHLIASYVSMIWNVLNPLWLL